MMNLALIPLFLGLGGQEILIIAVLVLLLFGGRKIPELMKGLGKGIKSFKEGMNGIDAEDPKEPKEPKAGKQPEEGRKDDAAGTPKAEA